MIVQFIYEWPPAWLVCLILMTLFFSIMTHRHAKISNRNLTLWIFLSLLLPVMTFFILVVLPRRRNPVAAVANEELFDHLFVKK